MIVQKNKTLRNIRASKHLKSRMTRGTPTKTTAIHVRKSKKNAPKKNSPEVEKAHQEAVLKSKKVHDKLAALEKVQDVAFLKN
jgi:hypothetical protein